MLFRQDINGLRAFAVVAVVLFHFSIAGFDGGFSGVDMFFVISGYLMTSIIFGKLDKNSFSILEFYLARAKRIIPALFFLCIFLLLLGWFILPPSEFKTLGKQTVGASTFLSNFIFLKGSGYFDSASHEKWLLHTWSLSVEWQFYIVYPVIIVLLRKLFSANFSRWFVLFSAIASLLLSALLPPNFSAFEFYMLPTRAWEMMAGGLVYLFVPKFNAKYFPALELAGIAIIVASIVFLDASAQWPGTLALIPVLGVVLVMCANREKSFITGNPLAQYLGTVSYSLYLWHWPIVVLLHMYDVFDDYTFKCAAIVLAMVLAHLSYLLIESRWRTAPRKLAKDESPSHKLESFFYKNKTTVFSLGRYATATVAIVVMSFAIVRLGGIPSRVDHFVQVADGELENRNPRIECFVMPSKNPKSPMCVFGKDKSKISAIVIGDSHSNATITAIAESIPSGNGGVLFLGADGCAAMMNLSSSHFYTCGTYNKTVMNYLNENLLGVPVIIVNHVTKRLLHPESVSQRTMYLDGVPNTQHEFSDKFFAQYKERVCEIAKKRPVYIMQPIPEMGAPVPQSIVRAKILHNKEIDVSVSRESYLADTAVVRDMIQISSDACNAKIIDPVDYLCASGRCLGSIKGRPLYYDDDHLSEYGNKLLVPMFKTIWQTLYTQN